MPAQVWISPLVFVILCPLIAALIIWGVWRFVRRANRKVAFVQAQIERANAKVETSEQIATIAREQHRGAVGVAQTAMQQTGQALHVAHEVTRVGEQMTTMSAQMDALIEFVAEGLSPLPHGRHARNPIPEEAHES